MSATLRTIRAVAFLGFIWLPLVGFLFFSEAPVDGRRFAQFPDVKSFVSKAASRAFFVNVVLGQSPLRRLTIRTLYAIQIYGFGYIDTPQLVSGRGDWLYYKEEFWGGKCAAPSYFQERLAYVDALQDVAAASGARLVIVVAPDKATIYPENLNPRAKGYWKCRPENGVMWRGLAANLAPRLVDHGLPLLQAKLTDPSMPLFFAHDTHWTPFAAALARRQSVSTLGGANFSDLPPPKISDAPLIQRTDMFNEMLLQPGDEMVPQVNAATELLVDAAVEGLHLGSTVVVGDSFYARYADQFLRLFHSATIYNPIDDIDKYQAAIGSADTIVVESVERLFFDRLSSIYSWSGPLGQSILARNQLKAGQCRDFQPALFIAEPRSLTHTASGWEINGADPSMPVSIPPTVPAELPCLRLMIAADKPDTLEIFLPVKGRPPDLPASFEGGRSIRVPLAVGTQEIRIILPGYVSGLPVRVDPALALAPVRVESVEVGAIAGQRVE